MIYKGDRALGFISITKLSDDEYVCIMEELRMTDELFKRMDEWKDDKERVKNKIVEVSK